MLIDRARAKINLTLHIEGRRPDGWHALESLVCFAGKSDSLTLAPGEALSLAVDGPTAMAAGDGDDNLVLRAARNLAGLVPGLTMGAFHLTKRLPVAAGVGGGSADAAAALRLLAQANGLSMDDERVMAAARATGADVPVCVGFGISNAEQAAMVAKSCDGVIVGSAIVKQVELHLTNPAQAVKDFTKPLIDAIR
jgi:4-diphosphocytidyl-2-C-methyl-D-erythritol kinase